MPAVVYPNRMAIAPVALAMAAAAWRFYCQASSEEAGDADVYHAMALVYLDLVGAQEEQRAALEILRTEKIYQWAAAVAIARRLGDGALPVVVGVFGPGWRDVERFVLEADRRPPPPSTDATWDDFANAWHRPRRPGEHGRAIGYTGNKA